MAERILFTNKNQGVSTLLFSIILYFFIMLWSVFSLNSLAKADPYASKRLSLNKTHHLISRAQPRISERHRRAWAKSLIWGLKKHQIKTNKENVCAMVAIIDQESNFKANPVVAGLGKKVIKTVHAKLEDIPLFGHYGKKFLKAYPSQQSSYYKMLRKAKTERDLDLTYRKLLYHSFGKLRSFSPLTAVLEGKNEIDTIGSMQVSVAYAIKQEEQRRKRALTLKEIEVLRDWMYTKRGGIYYGAKLLLGYRTNYRRKIYRFADYNAGRYASRNAGFQYMINQILGSKLSLDGDLLRYNARGRASWSLSQSEKALHTIIKRFRLKSLNTIRLRADLLKEKRYQFVHTKTYRKISTLYKRIKGHAIIRAKLPEIKLQSPKFSSAFTTKRFASKVNRRYQSCISRAKPKELKARSQKKRLVRQLHHRKRVKRTKLQRQRRYRQQPKRVFASTRWHEHTD